MDADSTRQAVYIPDNDKLWKLLDHMPPGLERDVDYAQFLLHSIGTKRWLGDVDDWGWARLKAEVLQQSIPNRVLPRVKGLLREAGVLELARYTVGVRSTGYKISPEFDGPPMRVLLTNPGLIRKRLGWRESYGRTDDPALVHVVRQRLAVLEQMKATLNRISLAETVENVVRTLRGDSVNTDHVKLVCSMISHDDHDGIIVDAFGFRVHSIITRTASAVRPFLRLDGQELTELDVKNAQPLLLAAALRRPEICTSYVVDAHHSGRERPAPSCWSVGFSMVDHSEVDLFTSLCENGELYEFLLDEGKFLDRETTKKLLFRDVLFCESKVRRPMTEVFARSFPGLFDAILQMKRAYDYKIIAKMLQRLESHIVIDCVCQRLIEEHPGLSFLTIHDSALVVASQGETVRKLIVEEFERFGVRADVREKHLTQGQ